MKRVESNTGLKPRDCRDTDVAHDDQYGTIHACIRCTCGKLYNIIVTATGAYADWSRADLLAEGELMLCSES